MGFEIDSEIKEILIEIDFIKRYEIISEMTRTQVSFEDTKDVPVDIIISIINRLNYDVKYYKKENFFKIGLVKKIPDYEIWFNISLNSGIAEFIWNVCHNNEPVTGLPWSMYSRLLISPDKVIKPPRYSNKENLEKLLKAVFELYGDFKVGVINKYIKVQ